ncbi:P-loop containing nucleoside triphosphate hydrolase protein [Suillus paluster]|uniref:P-loop containing nucleoside triphosphate hydrolase protein n=1 Tax=Suillus paluster TaxID=48578 RepID=UPI001B87F2B1|nr:P-loop containing nucleoside triphosphate hydrolase protein [Suillus paluster]KAG1744921.1 P-loop containing nucleoside triphosphate hydrolase protein [Suillus paluster]
MAKGRSTSKNVIIIGQSGVGKSSLINMLCPEACATTSNDTMGCTKKEQEYTCNLGAQQCTIHDTIGLEEGRWGFLPDREAQKRLKAYLKTKEPHLLVYCMPGIRGSLKKSQGRNYKKFKSAVGNVPIVVVVTNLEGFEAPLGNWWSENRNELQKLEVKDLSMILPVRLSRPSSGKIFADRFITISCSLT